MTMFSILHQEAISLMDEEAAFFSIQCLFLVFGVTLMMFLAQPFLSWLTYTVNMHCEHAFTRFRIS